MFLKVVNYLANVSKKKERNFESLKSQLKIHEGFRNKAYKCISNKLTIGIGRNIDPVGGKGITLDEAKYLLNNDIKHFYDGLNRNLEWFKNLDEVRQDVLINMALNLGVSGLLKWKGTLKAIKEKRWEYARDNMLRSKWAKQVKGRAEELANQIWSGVYKTS